MMVWPWQREPAADPEEKTRSKRELADAQRRLAEARKRQHNVDRVAGQVRRLRQDNHFGEDIAAALREPRRT